MDFIRTMYLYALFRILPTTAWQCARKTRNARVLRRPPRDVRAEEASSTYVAGRWTRDVNGAFLHVRKRAHDEIIWRDIYVS
jgi:hypothetical protein